MTKLGTGYVGPERFKQPAPTCQNCRHWKLEEIIYPFNPASPRVWQPAMDGYGNCALGESDGGRPIDCSPMFARDYEKYGADLYTLPTFSCNQHQPREE